MDRVQDYGLNSGGVIDYGGTKQLKAELIFDINIISSF